MEGGKGKGKPKGKRGGKKMPAVWFSLKRSLHCKSDSSDVHDPNSRKQQQQQLATILTRKSGRSGCSRSISNLKDVIHGSKRHFERPTSTCSPRSIGSNDFLNPIVHEVILSNSTCELKISGFGGGGGGGPAFVGTLKPGTPGPRGNPSMHYFNSSFKASSATPHRKSLTTLGPEGDGSGWGSSSVFGGGLHSKHRTFLEVESGGSSSAVACHRCGEQFSKWVALEAHHLSKHAVTELVEGDSSRKIVEIICRASWLKSENQCGRIERVLKVHNMQKTIARFEEYRETVKIKANRLPKKHARCIADGNELLRFHGTTIECSLSPNDSSILCASERCCVCRIIRNGFSTQMKGKGGVGVFTTSTSARAFESIVVSEEESTTRKALIVCRVIAGRVHRPLENIQEMVGQTGFDSVAGKVGLYSNIEELHLLNPRALLPCFVVVCRP